MKFAFISEEKVAFPVAALCRLLAVSPSGFYAAQGRPRSPHAGRDDKLAEQVVKAHTASKGRYGSPRVHCWDNAVAESFFSTLKRELEGIDDFESRAGATLSISDYIDGFYNVQRRHSAINYTSPIEFELIHSAKRAVALRNRPPNRVNPTPFCQLPADPRNDGPGSESRVRTSGWTSEWTSEP